MGESGAIAVKWERRDPEPKQHHFFLKTFENFTPHDLETEGNRQSLRMPE